MINAIGAPPRRTPVSPKTGGDRISRASRRTAGDAATIGASMEPTPLGVRTALTRYGQLLRDIRGTFKRNTLRIAPFFLAGLGAGVGVGFLVGLGAGCIFAGVVVVSAIPWAVFAGQSDNSARLNEAHRSLTRSLKQLPEEMVRGGILDLKRTDPRTYALITDKKALRGVLGTESGLDFIHFLRHFGG